MDPEITTGQLAKIPLFTAVNPDNLSLLLKSMKQITLPAKTIVCREGEVGDSFIILLDGKVEIIKSLDTHDEQVLHVAGPGNFIGEMSLLEPDGLRAASVRTRTPISALEMTREAFDEMLHNQPLLAYEISRVLSLRIRNSNNDLEEKNTQLEKALAELKAAQADIVEKERMEKELQVARKIQQDILPHAFPKLKGYTLGARMEPAREVGGDFFDFIPLSHHRTGIVIGDVSDKGVPAAIFMALTRALMRAETGRSATPTKVLERVNALLQQMSEAAMFVTVLYGILDCETHTFEYARAGHELPIYVENSGIVELPHGRGQPLSLFDQPIFDEQHIHLKPGQRLVLYTDGATDTTNEKEEFFGSARLESVSTNTPSESAQSLCDSILHEIKTHQGKQNQYDDITLVAIQVH